MGFKCVVPNCGVVYAYKSKTRLYRFPTDEVLRSKWMKSCSVTEHLVSYKVCSNHFLPEDIRNSGRLMPFAVPSIQLGVNLHPHSESSSQTDISTNNNFKPDGADSPQRSDTSTGLITNLSPTRTSKKRKFSLKHPRYFNDLTVAHFATPKRAKIYLELAKKKHHETIKKLKTVVLKKRRLAKKLKTFQDLFKTLEDSNHLKENASRLTQMPSTSLQEIKNEGLDIANHTFQPCPQKDTSQPQTNQLNTEKETKLETQDIPTCSQVGSKLVILSKLENVILPSQILRVRNEKNVKNNLIYLYPAP